MRGPQRSQCISALARWSQDYYGALARHLLTDTGIDPEVQPCGLLWLDMDEQAQAMQWAAQQDRPLENHGLGSLLLGQRAPGPAHRPRRGPEQPVAQSQQQTLTGTVWTDDTGQGASLEVETDPIEQHLSADNKSEMPYLKRQYIDAFSGSG